jgi:hypothetical protein
MSDTPGEGHVLPYAGRAGTRRWTGGLRALVVVKSLAALASLWLVPLAPHVYFCSDAQKWCRVQAFGLGVPAVFVLLVLLALTASCTLGDDKNAVRPRALQTSAWAPLVVFGIVLVALFSAVVHNR